MAPEKHKKVQVWVSFNDRSRGRVFLLLETTPARGAFWQPVTGSVEKGETLEQAALREATEESGLKFAGPPEDIGRQFEFESRGKQFVERGFHLVAQGQGAPPEITLDPHEHQGYRWVTPDEALSSTHHTSNREMLGILMARLS